MTARQPERWTTPVVDDPHDAIAVVGMSGRFPAALDLDGFWDNLVSGRESTRAITLAEFLAAGGTEQAFHDPEWVSVASTVSGIDRFDADFFGYRASEAELIDPQQRLFLECCHEALIQSGHVPKHYPGRIGVYGGASRNRYFLENVHPYLTQRSNSMAASPAEADDDPGGLVTRVAYKLGLTGPALAVHTTCSTSLVAIHLACQDLLNYQCEVALAGGASLNPNPDYGYRADPAGPWSPDGCCRAFDAAANGMFPGDGVGVVVLKRLADALADGDPIRAVVRGTAVNNDGDRKAGFGAPSVQGQVEVILAAQAAAGVGPEQIGYVEAHGSGTPVGDSIELKALGDAFRAGTDRVGYCLLGSIKPNLGHLDAASGVASFIKAVLALEHRFIPPSLHYHSPNPLFDLESSPFRVAVEPTGWGSGLPTLAAVSSFGTGGTNAHVILGPTPAPCLPRPGGQPVVLALSARNPAALSTTTAQLSGHLCSHPDLALADVAQTLWAGRTWFDHRTTVVATTGADACRALSGPLRVRQVRHDRPVVLVFSAGGTGYPAMGEGLYASEAEYRRVIDAARDVIASCTGPALLGIPRDPARAERAGDTPLGWAAIVATEIAVAATLACYDVHPVAVIGHGLGEYAAACVAGVMSPDDTLRIVVERERLFRRTDLPGAPSPLPEPELSASADAFSRIKLSAPHIPVISAGTGARLSDSDARDPEYWLRRTCTTVRFSDGVDTLHAEYSPLFVETGPGQELTRLIERQLGEDAVAPAVLRHHDDGTDDRSHLLAALGGIWAAGGAVNLVSESSGPVRKVILPGYPYQRRTFWIDRTVV